MKPRRRKSRPLTKSEQMARVRNKDTEPELALRRRLWQLGFRYRLRPKLPGTPDLIMSGTNVVVFVDGCFWHGCPSHYKPPISNGLFWKDKLMKNRSRDEAAMRDLEMQGWKVLRFWEHELTEDIESVIARIRLAIGR